MIQFNPFHDKVVKFYPYRTARLRNWGLVVETNDYDHEEIRDALTRGGFRMDNHIVFSTEVCNFWYSDGKLYIGGEIWEESY